MALNDDERFRRVYKQVITLWATMESGTDAEIDAETQKLAKLIEEREAARGP